jgi:hypothetical protein
VIRAVVFVVPFAGSILFVHFASKVVAVPTSSLLLFISWWAAMSGGATVVLFALERLARRLLPLVALYKLSLVFPDAAPSRFKTALRSNNVKSLEERIAEAKVDNDASTPVEAAERLLALVAELDSHDRLTRGHSERVRAYSRMIGSELRLSAEELELLNWAALLHDVGKLSVPTEILTKPGRPTDEEWAVLRRHPEFGDELVKPLCDWLGQWSKAVAQHHERWDGNGYPLGLEGDQIALAARVVAVADVFDVITSARSYKAAFASTAARDEIAKSAGTHFDPRVVRAFLNVSLGRLRLVMGPLSWLAHAPMLGRLPLTPAIGTVTASLATVAASLSAGVVATPPSAAGAAQAARPALVQTIQRTTREDRAITIGVDQAAGGARVITLRVSKRPSVGSVRVTTDRRLLYMPPPNFSGTVSIGYDACWAGPGCRRGTLVIRVEPVNDPPVARPDSATTRPGTAVRIGVLGNDSDPDGDALSIASLSGLGKAEAEIVRGAVRWTPPRGFAGTSTFRYVADDGHGGHAGALVTVEVSRSVPPPAPVVAAAAPPVGLAPTPPSVVPEQPGPARETPVPKPAPPTGNRAPLAQADSLSLPEGGTAIIDVLANDSDPDGGAIKLVSVGSPAHGDARRVGDRVQFTAPSDYVGRAAFPYVIEDAGGARAAGQVTVWVLLVNASPTFTAGPDQSTLEDAGPQTVAWAREIGPGARSEAGQTIQFEVSTDHPELFAAQPAIGGDGTLRYTPARDANGTAVVTVRAEDNGGTANGGTDTSDPNRFTITIRPVNDAPGFAGGLDQTSAEDAGPQTASRWATSISPGPANESTQTVGFVTGNSRPSLFTSGGQPKVSADGTLSYTTAPNENGSAVVTVQAKDDGGTADGGEDTSAAQTFRIVVRPVNDPPSFTAGGNQTVAEDAGALTVSGWASAISSGPPDESAESVGFTVSNDNNALFSVQPALSAGGTLTYTPAPNANGSATVTVRAHDDGGTANGGSDTSPPRTFTITVTPVNDPPVAAADTASVAEDDATGVTFDVLANDTDVDTGDTLTVASHDASGIANGVLNDDGGGSFTYIPDPGFYGTETFTYVVSDGNGGTATGTATITVTQVQHAPVAGDDAYTVAQDTTLSVSAPGALGNDGDPDGDTVTLDTTPVSGPTSGSLSLSSDGSFDYTPNAGFTGSDSFTYRIDDGTGRNATANVTLTVTAAPPSSSTLYFQTSGTSADVWNLLTSLAPAVPRLTDLDSDSKPGLTIKNSDGKETITEGAKFQTWSYTAPSPLVLDGPVTLDLWSSIGGGFGIIKSGTLYSYLYDCAPGGGGCIRIASNATFHGPWNTSLTDWGERTMTIGSVTRTIPAGDELQVKLLFKSEDLWLMMSAGYPSALLVTLG